MKEKSAKVMAKSMATLNLKECNTEKVTAALILYIGAIIKRYLEIYKEMPDQFIEQSEGIKAEIKSI